MNLARQIHIYIGCLFSPLLIYFALSGAWQVFDLHHHVKGAVSTPTQTLLHKVSEAHTDANDHSVFYKIFACSMAVGFIFSAILGIQMGLQAKTRRKKVLICTLLGTLLPILFLLL